ATAGISNDHAAPARKRTSDAGVARAAHLRLADPAPRTFFLGIRGYETGQTTASYSRLERPEPSSTGRLSQSPTGPKGDENALVAMRSHSDAVSSTAPTG